MITVEIVGADELELKFTAAAAGLSDGKATVGTNLSYAKPVHDGSPPHIIRARRGKALYWKGARHPVRSVRHPGTKGTKFLSNALVAEQGNVRADLEAGALDVVEGRASSLRPALTKAGYRVQRAGQTNVRVRSGTLRRSLRTEVQSR